MEMNEKITTTSFDVIRANKKIHENFSHETKDVSHTHRDTFFRRKSKVSDSLRPPSHTAHLIHSLRLSLNAVRILRKLRSTSTTPATTTCRGVAACTHFTHVRSLCANQLPHSSFLYMYMQ